MLTALIVDDEPLAREELRLLLEQAGNIRLLGECAHAMEALPAIHRLKPDLLFLDIQMPRISGLELVSMLDPTCVPHRLHHRLRRVCPARVRGERPRLPAQTGHGRADEQGAGAHPAAAFAKG